MGSSAGLLGFRIATTAALSQIFEIPVCSRQKEQNLRTHSKNFLSQYIMNSWDVARAFPPFSSFMVAVSSNVVKGVLKWPTTPGITHITLHCLLTERLCCLSAPLKRPLANSCFAMELAVIGHCFGSDFAPSGAVKSFPGFPA